MNTIDNVECFSNCTQLCKPHESNKTVWMLHEKYNNLSDTDWINYKNELSSKKINQKHKEFI
jgi:hypothetical protein